MAYALFGRWFNHSAATLTVFSVLALGSALAATPAGAREAIRILVLGDSLTAGYGLPAEQAFPTRLEAALRKRGHKVDILNGGISGDTTAGGRARLAWALASKPDAVIVELGGNDGLRGLDPADTRANMDAILKTLRDRQIPVLVAGMYAPRNLGLDYGKAFNALFPELAKKHDALLYPFFLDGVALDPKFNQRDLIHPNAEGVAVIVRRILPYVEMLVARAAN